MPQVHVTVENVAAEEASGTVAPWKAAELVLDADETHAFPPSLRFTVEAGSAGVAGAVTTPGMAPAEWRKLAAAAAAAAVDASGDPVSCEVGEDSGVFITVADGSVEFGVCRGAAMSSFLAPAKEAAPAFEAAARITEQWVQ